MKKLTQWNSTLSARRSPLKRSSKPLPKTGQGRVEREARYKKYLGSKDWKEKRDAVIARAGGVCERLNVVRDMGDYSITDRCQRPGHTVNHKSYGVTTLENVRLDKLEYLCKEHNAEYTTSKNPSFFSPRRRA